MLSQDQTVDLATYLRAHVPVPPASAAVFVCDLAEQLAALHAEGRAHGSLERGVRVEVGVSRAWPMIVSQGGVSTPADDVWEAGLLLAHLLGVSTEGAARLPARRPDEIPPQLWSLLIACLDRDPGNRPTASVLAAELRAAARDPLLGVWPALAQPLEADTADYVPDQDDVEAQETAARRRPRLGSVLLAIAVVVLVGVGAAAATIGGSAGEGPLPPVTACAPPECAATASLQAGGRLIVCDVRKDGHSGVAVYVRSDEPGEKAAWASHGTGTCVTHDTAAPPGVHITVKACTGERPTNRIVECGEPVTEVA
jgi:hypothetical protein